MHLHLQEYHLLRLEKIASNALYQAKQLRMEDLEKYRELYNKAEALALEVIYLQGEKVEQEGAQS